MIGGTGAIRCGLECTSPEWECSISIQHFSSFIRSFIHW